MMEHAAKAVMAALVGTVLGWGGHALTTAGRVDAIERTLQRIESRLDAIAATPARAAHAPETR